MHRILIEQPIPDPGQIITITDDEAAHAIRVKRLEPGEALGLLDGAGTVADGVVAAIHKGPRRDGGPGVEVRITARHLVPETRPRLSVLTATPKGGRVDEMIDGLSQVGAASWAPLSTARGVVDPREAKLARLERIAREAAKQCGRAWILRIDRHRAFAEALTDRSVRTILADASGLPFTTPPDAGSPIRLLIGPEGGWTPAELESARTAGATIARFGPHTMRIETAALAAAAVIMAGSLSPGATGGLPTSVL
jgi:16S rRNA (uracil1498-N3)-methyltransferase